MSTCSARELLERTDSILEPDAIEAVRQCVSSGEAPARVIELLAGNYQGYAQMSNLTREWLVVCGEDQHIVDEMIRDKLKELINANFDSKLADQLFDKDQTALRFLDGMVQRKEWREVIYQLSEKHPQSLFLKFAIQTISMSEHKKEIAAVASASSSFALFSDVLTETISALICEREVTAVTAFDAAKLDEFKKMCCKTEYTYLYALWLLHYISQKFPKYKSVLLKLNEELIQYATEKDASAQRLFLVAHDAEQHPELVRPLHGVAKTRRLNSPDVSRLFTILSQPRPMRPTVEVFYSAPLIEAIFAASFNGESTSLLPAQLREQSLQLLALIATMSEDVDVIMDTADYQDTLEALTQVQLLIMDPNEPSLVHSKLDMLQEACRFRVVASGVIWWLKWRFSNIKWFGSSHHEETTPLYLALLQHIGFQHPPLRPIAIGILTSIFEATIDTALLDLAKIQRLKKSVMDALMFFVLAGHPLLPMMHVVKKWCHTSDISLIWHFIGSLLQEVRPPFSIEFSNVILEILTANERTVIAINQHVEFRSVIEGFCDSSPEDRFDENHINMHRTVKATLAKHK